MTTTDAESALQDLEAVAAGDVDFRIITVLVPNGPVRPGMWCSHTLAAVRGVRGSDLSPRVRALMEAIAGKRALIVHKIKEVAGWPEADVTLRPADEETWAKLLMLCAAGLPGYEMECY